ncbi:MAG: hypothetical protein ACUVQL_07135 [Candidatus Bathycorpusculaceae bacterium]
MDRKEEAIKLLELLMQLPLADVVTLELLIKSGETKEAMRLAKKLKTQGFHLF